MSIDSLRDILEKEINISGRKFFEGKNKHTSDDRKNKDGGMYGLQEDGIILANEILGIGASKNKNLETKDFVMIADDVGIGKTYEGLGCIFSRLSEDSNKKNILVVAPNNAIGKKWIKEYEKFKKYCYIGKETEIKINNFLDNPLRLLNLDNSEHTISFIRLNSFSYIKERILQFNENPDFTEICQEKFKELENIIKPCSKKIKKYIKKQKINVDNEYQNINEFDKDNVVEENEAIETIVIKTLQRLNKYIKDFDLAIIDESQNLRGDEAIKNKNFNALFGLHRFPKIADESEEKSEMKFKKTIFLTATPDHNCKEDIIKQLSYVYDKNINSFKEDSIKILRKFEDYESDIAKKQNVVLYIIRRNRMFNGKNKYAYRKFFSEKSDMNFMEKLTMAVIQKKEIEENGTTFAMGYMDGFENFTVVENEKDDYENNNEKNKCRKNNYLYDLVCYEELKAKLTHPKIRKLVELMKNNEEQLDEIEKSLIFVRRKSSIKELGSKLVEQYDKEISKLVLDRIELGNVEKKKNIKTGNVIDLLCKKLSKTTGDIVEDENNEEQEEEENINGKNEDELTIESSWLKQLKKESKIFSFKNSFYRYKKYSAFWQDNFIENLGCKIKNIEIDEEQQLCVSIECDDNNYILSNVDNKSIKITRDEICKYKLADKKNVVDRARLKAAINLLILKKLKETEYDIETLYLGRDKLKLSDNNIENIIEKAVECVQNNYSIWDIEKIKNAIQEYINKGMEKTNDIFEVISQVRIMKEIIRKNIMNGEGMLYLASICENKKNPKKIKNGFEEDICKQLKEAFEKDIEGGNKFAMRILNRILNFIENFSDINGILGVEDLERIPVYDSPIGGCSGDVRNSTRENITKCFNTSFYPDIIISTDILKEGIDLQINCSRIIHYGIAWLPGDMEQRIGRIDRYFSKTYREIKKDKKIEIYFMYIPNSIDERQVSKIINRMYSSIDFLDGNELLKNEKNLPKDGVIIDIGEEYSSVQKGIDKLNKICEKNYLNTDKNDIVKQGKKNRIEDFIL